MRFSKMKILQEHTLLKYFKGLIGLILSTGILSLSVYICSGYFGKSSMRYSVYSPFAMTRANVREIEGNTSLSGYTTHQSKKVNFSSETSTKRIPTLTKKPVRLTVFPELILTEEKIDVKKVTRRVEMASIKRAINSTKLTVLRKSIMDFIDGKELRREFLMTQENVEVNSSYRMYKYKNAKNITMTRDTFKLLPEVSPFADRYFNICSVVGSSGILTGSNCGNNIDQAEFVFRMNDAPIKSYKKHVGSKNNITTLNGGTLSVSHTNVGCLAIGTPFNKHQDNYLWLRLPSSHMNKVTRLTSTGCQVFKPSEGQVLLGNPSYENTAIKFWQQYGIANHPRTTVTSGLYVLTVALTMCNHTHLYGFWPFATLSNERKVAFHYYNNRRKGATHTWDKEFEMLLRLHDARIIDLHLTCTPTQI